MGVSPSSEAEFSDPVLQATTVSDVEVLHYREECIFDQQWLADTYTKGYAPTHSFSLIHNHSHMNTEMHTHT
jgi:hypothetical protein